MTLGYDAIMKPIAIFRHHPHEGPGYLAHILEKAQVPYQVIRIDRGDALPARVDNLSGLVFMGGPMSVNDDLPWIAEELTLIRAAAAAKLPVLGHCLGGQLISKALGGQVTANPVREIGWYPVQTVEHPATRDWLPGLPAEFEVFHWHGETFSIPQDALPLLRGENCIHQAFAIDNMLALQCHIEMTADMVVEWVNKGVADGDLLPTQSVQSAAQITQDLAEKLRRLHDVAEIIYRRWLRTIG